MYIRKRTSTIHSTIWRGQVLTIFPPGTWQWEVPIGGKSTSFSFHDTFHTTFKCKSIFQIPTTLSGDTWERSCQPSKPTNGCGQKTREPKTHYGGCLFVSYLKSQEGKIESFVFAEWHAAWMPRAPTAMTSSGFSQALSSGQRS